MKQTFYSNGKLLITGEYTVLDGATAFALPTKFGQYLHVEPGTDSIINWISRDMDDSVWVDAAISFEDIKLNITQSAPEHNRLVHILHEAHKANPQILNGHDGFKITTNLTFPRKWGLGTSSTLINNIAQWFNIDAFQLLEKSFGGSGYDIACAQNDTPILYRLNKNSPIVSQIDFKPTFTEKLYFVYLNQKQDSREAIAGYKKKQFDLANTIAVIDRLTGEAVNSKNIQAFTDALEQHESAMSLVLQMPTIKENLFKDFPGTIKSLGAWGGDFILAISENDPISYFRERGYETVLAYNKMILK